MMMTAIADYKAFKTEIVDSDFADFQRNPGNLRAAFHCAISLFHLGDWVYAAHKPTIDAGFTFTTGAQKNPVRDEKMFANALADINPDFELIRGVANSVKHLQLKPFAGSRAQPPHMPTNAANTQSISYSGFGDAPIGAGPLGGWTDVELEGSNRKMIFIATSVHNMWRDLFMQHGW